MHSEAQMNVLQAIKGRTTVGRLILPAPDDAALGYMFAAAVRAPDHGKLKPWRFHVVRGDGLRALGEVLARALRERVPVATDDQVERERQKPMRAPMVVVVAARVDERSNIPPIEQLLAAGAATQNMLIAAHALGYGSAWKTGDAAYDDSVKASFGLRPIDAIVGFVYLGSVERSPRAPEHAVSSAHVTEWRGA